VEKVLDYDYAPMSRLVEGRRKYFNVSQEGISDIDFLREEKLVNSLKLSSSTFEPVTCYQISEKGDQLLKHVGKIDREAVHECVYPPQTRDLLFVHWDTKKHLYSLRSENGYKRVSDVTDCEDVSYVSSAYLPQCLRNGGRPTMSNAHRAHECRPKAGESNIRDELDEVISLNSVSLIVSEYIPSGANQIVQMNMNLGSMERVQGGYYSAKIDRDTTSTKLDTKAGLTHVSILDYTMTNHVNFEADIHFPEDDGVVQVETFGCSLNAHGSMFYGMQVEAILDRVKDQMSLDHLSRLLVDVHMDSSKIVDSIISPHQRELMQLIFDGDAAHRDKVNLIIANEITPHLTAEEYMDKGQYENELRQVLGETRSAYVTSINHYHHLHLSLYFFSLIHPYNNYYYQYLQFHKYTSSTRYDISEHDTLVFGESGVLIAGANARHHEPLLVSYLQITSMDVFVRNYYNRMFVIQNRMSALENLIHRCHESPKHLHQIHEDLGILFRDVIFMKEILHGLHQSVEDMRIPPEPPEQSGRALYDRLKIGYAKKQLLIRVTDFHKFVSGSEHALVVMKEMLKYLNEDKAMNLRKSIGTNTRRVCDLSSHNRKQANSLNAMQIIIAGVLAFDVCERVTGEWSVVNAEWMRGFVRYVGGDVEAREYLFLSLSLSLSLSHTHSYTYLQTQTHSQHTGGTHVTRISVRLACDQHYVLVPCRALR